MRKTIKTILIAGALLSLGIVNAQEAKEQPLKPGDVIKLDLEFRGPDADQLTSINASLYSHAPRPEDQAGFMTNFPGEFKLTSPRNFHAEFKVPDTAVSGEYKLDSLDVRGLGIQLTYTDGEQYHLHTFHVDNKDKFVQPSVTIKEVH